MLNPIIAAVILLGVFILLVFIIPLLDGSKRFSKYISLRYTLVSVILCASIGCVLDFSHLAESSRNIVLIGGTILVGLFVIVRSLEKCKLGARTLEIEAHKGDMGTSITLKGSENGKEKD